MKVKPSEDFFRKYGIRNFEIEYVNLFSRKKEMEIFIKVSSLVAHSEIQDLRQLLYKSFENGLKLKIKMDVNPELRARGISIFLQVTKWKVLKIRCL